MRIFITYYLLHVLVVVQHIQRDNYVICSRTMYFLQCYYIGCGVKHTFTNNAVVSLNPNHVGGNC